MYKSEFRLGGIILRRELMIPFYMLLRDHFINTKIIDLLFSVRRRVDGLGVALWYL